MNRTKLYLPPTLLPAVLSSGPAAGSPCSSGASASHLLAPRRGAEVWPLPPPLLHFAGVPLQLQEGNQIGESAVTLACYSCPLPVNPGNQKYCFLIILLDTIFKIFFLNINFKCCFLNDWTSPLSCVFFLRGRRYLQVVFLWLTRIMHRQPSALHHRTDHYRKCSSYMLLLLFDLTDYTLKKSPFPQTVQKKKKNPCVWSK